MALDASIYQNIQPVQAPDMLGSAEKAASLSQLMMNADTQRAMREAYAQNTDASGNLNQRGFLSAIGRVNPQAALAFGKQITEQSKLGAETQTAQAEAYQKQKSMVANAMLGFQNVPDSQKPMEWQNMLHDLATQGVEISRLPSEYNPQAYAMILHGSNQHIGQTSKDYLGDRLTEAQIGKTNSERNQVRTNQLTDYQKFAQNDELIKKPMEMLAMGKNGYAVINDALQNAASRAAVPVFLARFTTAGQRMNEAEITPQEIAKGTFGEKLKQMQADAVSGKFTKESADYAKQFLSSQMKSIAENLKDARMQHAQMYSNANGDPLDVAHYKLFSSLPGSEIQTPEGPARFAKKQTKDQTQVASGGGLPKGMGPLNSTAGAAERPMNQQTAKYRPTGAQVSADELNKYAMKHKMKLSDAEQYLRSQGYAINR